MTTTILAAVTGAFMLGDWWATWAKRQNVRTVTKPAALLFLIVVAVAIEPFVYTIRTWMVIGLALSLIGDVFLLGDSKATFIGGLVSFLLGHVVYVVAMQQAPRSVPWTIVGLVLVAVAIGTVGRRIVSGVGASGNRELVPAVIAYLVVISAMVVSAFGTAAPWAIIGAGLFYASDATLAWNRFIEERRFGPLAVMVTYHLGQAGLVAWLVTG
ncbi:MAG: lysoplasmalogenase [Acidimicrobiales bacterium]|nr:lysoplasmalogenase [Acidimicrobiales bacterium]